MGWDQPIYWSCLSVHYSGFPVTARPGQSQAQEARLTVSQKMGTHFAGSQCMILILYVDRTVNAPRTARTAFLFHHKHTFLLYSEMIFFFFVAWAIC